MGHRAGHIPAFHYVGKTAAHRFPRKRWRPHPCRRLFQIDGVVVEKGRSERELAFLFLVLCWSILESPPLPNRLDFLRSSSKAGEQSPSCFRRPTPSDYCSGCGRLCNF